MSMRQQGLVKGGTDACAIVGYGDRWYEPQRVRFMDDEPVRHKMLDLIVSVVGSTQLDKCCTEYGYTSELPCTSLD